MMKRLSQSNKKNKKAISNMVAYTILISMTLVLSVFVGNWLRFYAEEGTAGECPENVEVSLANYSCTSGPFGEFSAAIKNTGLFRIDGVVVRITDDEAAKFADLGNWHFDWELDPGETNWSALGFGYDKFDRTLERVTLIEMQPFIYEIPGDNSSKKTICPQITRQKIECEAGDITQ
jgi:hypothetical protein